MVLTCVHYYYYYDFLSTADRPGHEMEIIHFHCEFSCSQITQFIRPVCRLAGFASFLIHENLNYNFGTNWTAYGLGIGLNVIHSFIGFNCHFFPSANRSGDDFPNHESINYVVVEFHKRDQAHVACDERTHFFS